MFLEVGIHFQEVSEDTDPRRSPRDITLEVGIHVLPGGTDCVQASQSRDTGSTTLAAGKRVVCGMRLPWVRSTGTVLGVQLNPHPLYLNIAMPQSPPMSTMDVWQPAQPGSSHVPAMSLSFLGSSPTGGHMMRAFEGVQRPLRQRRMQVDQSSKASGLQHRAARILLLERRGYSCTATPTVGTYVKYSLYRWWL